jgi:hypothetical protein
MTPEVAAKFSNYADQQGWTWRGGGTGESFESRRWTWVNNTFPKRYEGRTQYETCVRLCNNLKDLGAFDQICDLAGNICDFLRPGFVGTTALTNTLRLTTCLKEFDGEVPKSDLVLILLEAFKFIVPTGPPDSCDKSKGVRTSVPWVFDRVAGELFDYLKADMGESVVSKKASAKAAGKAKAKAKAAAKKGAGAAVAIPPEVFRSKQFLDDLVNSIESVFASCGEANGETKLKVKSLLYSLGLEFCWKGEIKFLGTTHSAWSTLRESFRKFTFEQVQNNTSKELELHFDEAPRHHTERAKIQK